ncbi:MAG: hypothetical protein H0T84_04815 [Tatlockia sp.]|nr:hypothetical protein [Tatlockia sp.]
MFKNLQKTLALITLFFSCTLTQASIQRDDPRSYVGTTANAKYSQSISERSAFSLLGEAGPRNYRFGATLGWQFFDNQRIKISGEFLEQDILYAFFSGNSREWVRQGAFGAHYQYDLSQFNYHPQFNLKAGYSHAPNKQLSLRSGFFTNRLAAQQNYIEYRRIAGSDAGYVSPGVSIMPWQTGRIGAELNYDDVRYDAIYQGRHHAEGFGGSINYNQQLGAYTDFDLNAGFRKPFNMYHARIGYTLPSRPNWSIGVDANYVDGKHRLPNTYNVGIGVRYALKEIALTANYLDKDAPLRRTYMPLNSWIASPAIYLPQVLAITDSKVDIIQPLSTPTPAPNICVAPTVIGTIDDQFIEDGEPNIVPTTDIFSGTTPFSYSVSISPPTNGGAPIVTIDSSGTITINPGVIPPQGTEFEVTVVATNACGSVSTSFTVVIDNVV